MAFYRRLIRSVRGEGVVTKAGKEVGRASLTLDIIGVYTKVSEEQGEVQMDDEYKDGLLRMITGSIQLETTYTLKLDNGEWYQFIAVSQDGQTYSIIQSWDPSEPVGV